MALILMMSYKDALRLWASNDTPVRAAWRLSTKNNKRNINKKLNNRTKVYASWFAVPSDGRTNSRSKFTVCEKGPAACSTSCFCRLR